MGDPLSTPPAPPPEPALRQPGPPPGPPGLDATIAPNLSGKALRDRSTRRRFRFTTAASVGAGRPHRAGTQPGVGRGSIVRARSRTAAGPCRRPSPSTLPLRAPPVRGRPDAPNRPTDSGEQTLQLGRRSPRCRACDRSRRVGSRIGRRGRHEANLDRRLRLPRATFRCSEDQVLSEEGRRRRRHRGRARRRRRGRVVGPPVSPGRRRVPGLPRLRREGRRRARKGHRGIAARVGVLSLR